MGKAWHNGIDRVGVASRACRPRPLSFTRARELDIVQDRSNIFPVGIQKTAVRVQINHIHPRSHGTADLYHRALLIVNYVFTVLKKTHIPWLQRHCLVYMWFVHCGVTF